MIIDRQRPNFDPVLEVIIGTMLSKGIEITDINRFKADVSHIKLSPDSKVELFFYSDKQP